MGESKAEKPLGLDKKQIRKTRASFTLVGAGQLTLQLGEMVCGKQGNMAVSCSGAGSGRVVPSMDLESKITLTFQRHAVLAAERQKKMSKVKLDLCQGSTGLVCDHLPCHDLLLVRDFYVQAIQCG